MKQMTFQAETFPANSFIDTLPEGLTALRFWHQQSNLPRVRICAVGDIGLSGRVALRAQQTGYEAFFQAMKPLFEKSDIVFANLETPLLNMYKGPQLFGAPASAAPALAQAGFTLLNLANNHIYDYGAEGLQSTINACQSSCLQILGAGDSLEKSKLLIRIDSEGVKTGWLGCGRTLVRQADKGPSYWELDEAQLSDAVSQTRSQVDVLIVSLHLGLMYLDYPHPRHKELAEHLQRQGADLIFMHHAHVLQGVQVDERGRSICYSLGNFLLDWREGNVTNQIVVREQNESAVFVFDVTKTGIIQAIALPIYIGQNFSLEWARGHQGDEIHARLQRISQELLGDYTKQFEHQRAERNAGPLIEVAMFHLKKKNWSYFTSQLSRVRFEHLKMLLRYILHRLVKNTKYETD